LQQGSSTCSTRGECGVAGEADEMRRAQLPTI
jgi:hypothetical protein